MEAVPQGQRNKWSVIQWNKFYKRKRVADIQRVVPDGYTGWGTRSGLPRFVWIHVPGMSVAAGQAYMDQVLGIADTEGNQDIVRLRRYSILRTFVQNMVNSSSQEVTILVQGNFDVLIRNNQEDD